MSEENILFQPIKKYCRRNVATCDPEDSVLQVAGVMRDLKISSVVICEENNPVGILMSRATMVAGSTPRASLPVTS